MPTHFRVLIFDKTEHGFKHREDKFPKLKLGETNQMTDFFQLHITSMR